jgi:hypothetical protein
MKWGLVELRVDGEGIGASSVTLAVRLGITRNPDGRSEPGRRGRAGRVLPVRSGRDGRVDRQRFSESTTAEIHWHGDRTISSNEPSSIPRSECGSPAGR